jgi:DNA-binding SARP family transcriptional activator
VGVRAALAESLLQIGRPRDGIAHFEALLAVDPERESWHRGLMRCYFEAGDRALALRQFHACRSVLRQSQGTEPSPETHSLYLELLQRR